MKKGRSRSKRPKSREETPKEGGGERDAIARRTGIGYPAMHHAQEDSH